MVSGSANKRRQPPLSRHPAFIPLVTLWLAALMGGCVAVLREGHAMSVIAATGVAIPPALASQPALAGLCAITGAIPGWVLSRTVARRQSYDRSVAATRGSGYAEASGADHQQIEQPVVAADHEPTPDTEVITGETAEREPISAESNSQELPASVNLQIDAHVRPLSIEELQENEPQTNTMQEPELDEPMDHNAPDRTTLVNVAIAKENKAVELDTVLSGLLNHAAMVALPHREAREMPGREDDAPSREIDAEESLEAVPPARASKHGKAVKLLRGSTATNLAMPQLIERFAVALDDRRREAEDETRLLGMPPRELGRRLRVLIAERSFTK